MPGDLDRTNTRLQFQRAHELAHSSVSEVNIANMASMLQSEMYDAVGVKATHLKEQKPICRVRDMHKERHAGRCWQLCATLGGERLLSPPAAMKPITDGFKTALLWVLGHLVKL